MQLFLPFQTPKMYVEDFSLIYSIGYFHDHEYLVKFQCCYYIDIRQQRAIILKGLHGKFMFDCCND